METLGNILIIFFLLVIAACITMLTDELKQRSRRKSDARREASRHRDQQPVHDSWTIERNRRNLWSRIDK